MTLFGPRVIGEKAFQEQQAMVESGAIHFGPRVVGPAPHTHGERVVGEATAAMQADITEVAGKPATLDELKRAELQAICDKLKIKYQKVKDSNATLADKITAEYARRGAIPPPAVTGRTSAIGSNEENDED